MVSIITIVTHADTLLIIFQTRLQSHCTVLLWLLLGQLKCKNLITAWQP